MFVISSTIVIAFNWICANSGNDLHFLRCY